MEIPDEVLNQWLAVLILSHRNSIRLTAQVKQHQLHRVEELSDEIRSALDRLVMSLENHGAVRSSTDAQATEGAVVPPHLLYSEANQALAKALENAYDTADRVDEERNRPNDGLVHVILEMLIKVEREIVSGEPQGNLLTSQVRAEDSRTP